MGGERQTGRMRSALAIAGLWLWCAVQGQISPGDLTTAHAHLEGVMNCTQCHVLGDKVTNAKCLDCHKEIKSRTDRGKGYHASSDVRGKDCFSCHSEHHGRNFEIVRFDQNTFDHRLTGYALTGAHLEKRADCAACHKMEWVTDPALKTRKHTYLGLDNRCATCHTDVHQGTLSTGDCAACHTTEAFRPASAFDHADTDFPLRGKHQQVDCKSCHAETVRSGQAFTEYADVPFASCVQCHTDPHQKRLGNECAACHREDGFEWFAGRSSFNHQRTRFPLQGQHRRLDCAACHTDMKSATATSVFREYAAQDFNRCATCHTDVHEGKFGQECQQCHTVESFRTLLHADEFDHDLTGWPLEGRHQPVDCKSCHAARLTDPVPHDRCMDCHEDFHEGQFVRADGPTDCASCHTVEGFEGSLYTIDRHNEGPFPLVGAHMATPCFACHREETEWQFRDLGSRCIDCHEDVHAGELDESFYPQQACDACHTPEAWGQVTFDHGRTDFVLTGQHLHIECRACHQPDPAQADADPVRFAGLDHQCAACHDNIHGRQFQIEGVTDCARCHAPDGWVPGLFDHSTARFPLEGAHAKLECRRCHREEEEDGVLIVRYRLEQFECADCHQ